MSWKNCAKYFNNVFSQYFIAKESDVTAGCHKNGQQVKNFFKYKNNQDVNSKPIKIWQLKVLTSRAAWTLQNS